MQPLAAYVLHRYDWSETSLILEVFTREQGRLAVAAKGAKRPYSQLRAVLLPFQRVALTVSRPARKRTESGEPVSDIQTLRSAEWAGGGPMLTGAALFTGFYLNELLLRLLARHDPHPALFDAYAGALPALASGDAVLTQTALRAFELVALREIGVLPALDTVSASGAPLQPDAPYALSADGGLVARHSEATLTGAQWQAIEAALAADELAAVQRACAPALGALRTLLRGALHYHLAHLGAGPLRTPDVLRDAWQLAPVLTSRTP